MKNLTTDEHAEWVALLDTANARKADTQSARAYSVIDLLEDAEQAQRKWAPTALRELAADGARSALKKRTKERSRVFVPVGTSVAHRSMRVGVRSQQADGSDVHQQKLFEEMTWAELDDHVQMLEQQLRSLGVTLAVDRKLIKLRGRYPDSVGPRDACAELGLSVEEFLAAEVAA
ncbi:MAG: hypothetical protein KUG69_15330 [Marinosulfonomonas sp.]|nr:hypothetical protein [Marinosulfonomonas sp.]